MRLKLLFCIKAMNNPGGGAERVLAYVANGLVKRGYRVGVLSFDQPGGHSFYNLDPKIDRIELGIGSTIKPASTFITIKRIKALRKNVKAYAPDVTIGFMHSMFIPLGFALLGTSIPMIASEHIVPEHYRKYPLQLLLFYSTPFIADQITCVSEQVQKLYHPFIARKMFVVPNPIGPKGYKHADVLGRDKKYKILLAVGRLEPQKDYLTLIKAFSMISDYFPDWNLRIVGDGQMRQRLESVIKNRGLKNRIYLPGAKREISKEYLSAQLFVQSSRYESFCLTTAEALSHGLPVVGFKDCPGVNQLIINGVNGYLVTGKRNKIVNLANTLKSLMQNDKLRIELSQHSTITLNKYSLENILDRWEEIIHRVINKPLVQKLYK